MAAGPNEDAVTTPVLTDRQKALQTEARQLWWWHHIPLGSFVTPGHNGIGCQQWLVAHLPERFTGLSVLDVGAADGYYSFEAERRGAAKVLAIDSYQGRAGSWPHQGEGDLRTFNLAKEFFSSSVTYRILPLEEMGRGSETFDAILCFGVYYHSKDPVRQLETLSRLLRPNGFLLFEGLVAAGREAKLYRLSPRAVEPLTFCAGTLAWIRTTAGRFGLVPEGDPGVWIGGRPLAHRLAEWTWRLGVNPPRLRRYYRAVLRFRKPAAEGGLLSSPIGC